MPKHSDAPVVTPLPPLEALAHAPGGETYPTPFLAIDLDAMERNIAQMQGFFEGRTAGIRPHVKSHKSSAIARLQMEAGAVGVTCSTTDEVAAMVAAGVPDVLLANVVADSLRLASLAASARAGRVTVAVDSSASVAALARAAEAAGATIGVVIDFDIGMRRNGVPDVEDGLAVAEELTRANGLELRGVMAYEGHLVSIAERAERARAATDAFAGPIALLGELRRRGFDAPILTGGATATYDSSGVLPEMTDVQAGTYVLMDATYRKRVPEFETAIALIATVATVRRDGRIVLDAGAKRLATDLGKPELLGFEAEHSSTAEEHTMFQSLGGPLPSVGDRVAVLPAHVCTTMSMYGRALGFRAGALERLLEIDGRDPLASSRS